MLGPTLVQRWSNIQTALSEHFSFAGGLLALWCRLACAPLTGVLWRVWLADRPLPPARPGWWGPGLVQTRVEHRGAVVEHTSACTQSSTRTHRGRPSLKYTPTRTQVHHKYRERPERRGSSASVDEKENRKVWRLVKWVGSRQESGLLIPVARDGSRCLQSSMVPGNYGDVRVCCSSNNSWNKSNSSCSSNSSRNKIDSSSSSSSSSSNCCCYYSYSSYHNIGVISSNRIGISFSNSCNWESRFPQQQQQQK